MRIPFVSRYVEREDEFDIIPANVQNHGEATDVFVDIAAASDDEGDDSAPGGVGAGAGGPGLVGSTGRLGVGAPVCVPPLREQLLSLPITIIPDTETLVAYQARRAIALEREEKKRADQAAATAAATVAAAASDAQPASMDTQTAASPAGAKRPLEETPSAAGDEAANKKPRV